MADLYSAEITVKGVSGELIVSNGQLTVTQGAQTWSCPVGDIVGYRAKKPGLSGGYLCIDARGGRTPATGVTSAIGHPQAVLLNTYGKWNAAQHLIELLDAHSPTEGCEVQHALAKVRSNNGKQMKQLDGLKSHLEPGEIVNGAVFGIYETEILGSDTVRNGVLAATDRRLIFYAKKMTGYDLESFTYDKVSSFEKSKSLMGEKYSFFASGNKVEIKWVSESVGEDLALLVRSGATGLSRASTPTKAEGLANNSLEQIRELAALHREGILTDEEFAAAKAKLLSM